MAALVEVEVKVTREVTDEALIREPLRRFFQRLMVAAHAEVAVPGRAPIDTNRLRASLAPGGGVTSSGDEYAQVGTNVAVYPRVLEESDRYLYAGGPSKGQPTTGWLSKTVPAMGTTIQSLLATCATEIEEAWRG